MVVASLTIGALVGVVLSGGFVYWEVGRYATPQVPVSRFDERKEMFAYTAGLFVGVPLAVAYVLFREAFAGLVLIEAAIFLAGLVVGTEVAQRMLLRSRFWPGAARPFYALGFRAAVGGILALAIVAQYAGGPLGSALDLAQAAATAVAVVALEVAGTLVSLPPVPGTGRQGGGPITGGVVATIGFLLLGFGSFDGPAGGLAAALLLLAGCGLFYQRLRPILDRIAAPEPPSTPTAGPSPYGRTERAPLPSSTAPAPEPTPPPRP